MASNEGWNKIEVGDPANPDVELYDKTVAGSTIDGVKAIITIPVPPQVNACSMLSFCYVHATAAERSGRSISLLGTRPRS